MQKRRLGNSNLEVSALGLGEIQTAASKITPRGEPYPERLERMTGR